MKEDKFQRMNTISHTTDVIGTILTIMGFYGPIKENEILNTTVSVTGGVCSIVSFVNYMLSLEQYGVTKDIDENEIIAKMMWNLVVLPVANTLSMAGFVKERNKKRQPYAGM